MDAIRSVTLRRIVTLVTAILIFKVTLSVVTEYRRYVPPDFQSDFLQGREAYFWDGYHWAFFAHLVSGPASLVYTGGPIPRRKSDQASAPAAGSIGRPAAEAR